MGLANRRSRESRPSGFSADNVVPLDNGSHAHTRVSVLNSRLDTQDFSQGVYQNFRTIC